MPTLTTVLDTIDKGTAYLKSKGIEDARKNMQLLVTHQLGCSRVELYMQFDRPMEESELIQLRENLKQRSEGVPLQHILGTVEFYKREFKTDARALIPRPETEELADIILKKINASPSEEKLRVLDMGTGSGVLGLTLFSELGGKCESVTLVDISPDALSLAKENAELLGASRYSLIESNLFSSAEFEEKKYHLIVANLPYIAETDRASLSTEVMQDPETALFGGKDGLDIIKKFIQQVRQHLVSGGMIALEIGYDQAEAVESLLNENGFKDIITHNDLTQIPRFPIAIYP